jgi:hypothetical protein
VSVWFVGQALAIESSLQKAPSREGSSPERQEGSSKLEAFVDPATVLAADSSTVLAADSARVLVEEELDNTVFFLSGRRLMVVNSASVFSTFKEATDPT